MRLTGGEHSGRLLKVPADGTRPTQDKVRAAIYSSLAAAIPGARVLDLFAGTGALGLEAWSRGAAWVDWVESGPNALRALRDNLKALGVPPAAGRVLAADVFCGFLEAGVEDDEAVRRLGRRYAETFLARGGAEHPMDVFKAFRGREPDPAALLRLKGLAS